MNTFSENERKRQQDILQRIDQELNVLEERATAQLSNIDFKSMTPAQRTTATGRLIRVMLDLLKLRKQFTGPDELTQRIFNNLMLSLDNAIEKLTDY